MEYIKAFLTNSIVIAWIAPVFTGVIATIIIKAFSIRKKKKEIYMANQKFADAIRPYVIQKISLNEQMIHGIRTAISLETSVPEKYIYSDMVLRDVLIYDITTTRFMTEQGKIELIQNVIDMFQFAISSNIEPDNAVRGMSKLGTVFSVGIAMVSLVITIVTYYFFPEEVKNPDSTAQIIVSISMIISVITLTNTTWRILDNLRDEEDDFFSRGIIGEIIETESQLIREITYLFFGKRENKGDNKDDVEK